MTESSPGPALSGKIFQQSPPGSLLAGDGSITQPPLGLGLLDAAEEAVRLSRVSWEHPHLESRETRDTGPQSSALGEPALLGESAPRDLCFQGKETKSTEAS